MGKLSFNIELTGAQAAAMSLKEIVSLQQKIKELGLGKSGLGNMLASLNPKSILKSQDLQKELSVLTEKGLTAGAKNAMKAFPYGAFLNQTLGIGAGQNTPNRQAYMSFWRNAVPPQLVPPVIPQGINWKQAMLGAATSPFSPWLGARALNQSGIFGAGKGGIFGAGGVTGFVASFLAIKAVTEGLRMAFVQLKQAVEEGSRLYQQSARTAVSTGKLFQLQSIGQAIGLSSAQMENLIVRGEHPLKGGGAVMSQQDIGQLFGAGRGVAQIGELQQIKNMSEDVKRAWRDTAFSAYEMQRNAKPLQELHYQMTRLAIEWKTTWADLATMILPAVKAVINEVVAQMRLMKIIFIDPTMQMMQALKLIPVGQPGSSVIPTPSAKTRGGSPWENMGFVIGGFGSNNYAKTTAENTTKIAKHAETQTSLAKLLYESVKAGSKAVFNNIP